MMYKKAEQHNVDSAQTVEKSTISLAEWEYVYGIKELIYQRH